MEVLGGANINGEITVLGGDDNDTVFAYQFMAGIGFEINPKTTLTVGYRYFATTDPEFVLLGLPTEFTISSHDFNVGARLMF